MGKGEITVTPVHMQSFCKMLQQSLISPKYVDMYPGLMVIRPDLNDLKDLLAGNSSPDVREA